MILGLTLLPADGSACWDEAATRYQVSPTLLHAIARTESALDPKAIGRNKNGSRDIGLMQINSSWFAELARYGIEESHLFEPCTNIHVGAWILAQNISRYGYTWEAVGAYNAADPKRRQSYIAKVRRQLAEIMTRGPSNERLNEAALSLHDYAQSRTSPFQSTR